MTADDVEVLKRCQDYVLAVERVSGEQYFAEVVFVVDEPPTPDALLLRVDRQPDGTFVAAADEAESVLLSDISRIALIPGVPYPTD